MSVIGELSLWVALLMTLWAAAVSLIGARRGRRDLIASGERAMHASLAMLLLCSAGLWTALFTRDFSIEYVAAFTSANLPRIYTFAAFWAGQPGAILFLALVLSILSSIAICVGRALDRELIPYVTATLGSALFFLVALSCLAANPFLRVGWPPAEGRGLAPLLQNPGMLIHPSFLHIGYAGTIVAFAFAVGAVARKRAEAQWIRALIVWAMVAWTFLTIGVVTGMRWAYVEPSSGSAWLLDSLLDGSLFPWIATTALLRSLSRPIGRSSLRPFDVVLLAAAFILSIHAAFATRAGIAHSLNWFPEPPLAPWFAVFAVTAIAAATYLAKTAAELRHATGDEGDLTEAMRGSRASRFGGYAVALGLILIAASIAAQALSRQESVTLRPGESRDVQDPFGGTWTIGSLGFSRYDVLNRHVSALALDLKKEGERAGVLTTERREHIDSRGSLTYEPSIESGVMTGLGQDVVAFLSAIGPNGAAQVQVRFNPMVTWLWVGIAVAAIGWVGVVGSTLAFRAEEPR